MSEDLLAIRRSAMNLLARREHTYTELIRKLQVKQFADIDVQHVLKTLTQEGLLNHRRFTESYIHYRRGKGYGPIRIRAELMARGVEEELIAEYLNITDNSWQDDLYRVWKKRFKATLPKDNKTRMQQVNFLNYRGFTHEHIEKLLKL